MDNKEKDFGWDYFENIYKNTMQKNVTFSKEMGEEMQREFQKMLDEYNEWLKQKQNDTGTISESIDNS